MMAMDIGMERYFEHGLAGSRQHGRMVLAMALVVC
jgi:hypothetical protein